MPEEPVDPQDRSSTAQAVVIVGDDLFSQWFEKALDRRFVQHDHPIEVTRLTHCAALDNPELILNATRVFIAGETDEFCSHQPTADPWESAHEPWSKALGATLLERMSNFQYRGDPDLRVKLGRLRIILYTRRADRLVLMEHFYCAQTGPVGTGTSVVDILTLLADLEDSIEETGLYRAVMGETLPKVRRPLEYELQIRGIRRLTTRRVRMAMAAPDTGYLDMRSDFVRFLRDPSIRPRSHRGHETVVDSIRNRIETIFNGRLEVAVSVNQTPGWRRMAELWRLLDEFFALDAPEQELDPAEVKRRLVEGRLAPKDRRAAGFALKVQDWKRWINETTSGARVAHETSR